MLDSILNVSRGGQVEIADLIRVHLQRIERDPRGVPIRLYPFTRKQADKEAIKSVVMDPRIAFGRPVLVGTAVPTSVLADRFKAGDTLTDLAKDYGAKPSKKRSAASSTAAKLLEQTVFYLDESIYSRVLAAAITDAGAQVRTPADVAGFGAADEQWLSAAASESRPFLYSFGLGGSLSRIKLKT